MNPIGLLTIVLGLALVIIGIKGTQHQIVAALTNKPAKSS